MAVWMIFTVFSLKHLVPYMLKEMLMLLMKTFVDLDRKLIFGEKSLGTIMLNRNSEKIQRMNFTHTRGNPGE